MSNGFGEFSHRSLMPVTEPVEVKPADAIALFKNEGRIVYIRNDMFTQ